MTAVGEVKDGGRGDEGRQSGEMKMLVELLKKTND